MQPADNRSKNGEIYAILLMIYQIISPNHKENKQTHKLHRFTSTYAWTLRAKIYKEINIPQLFTWGDLIHLYTNHPRTTSNSYWRIDERLNHHQRINPVYYKHYGFLPLSCGDMFGSSCWIHHVHQQLPQQQAQSQAARQEDSTVRCWDEIQFLLVPLDHL